jgi:hypothetical protein
MLKIYVFQRLIVYLSRLIQNMFHIAVPNETNKLTQINLPFCSKSTKNNENEFKFTRTYF